METPDQATAEGMRRGIFNQREREGQTGPHPYAALDLTKPEDRRIIAAVYADMVGAGR